jgi:hypothetical protein
MSYGYNRVRQTHSTGRNQSMLFNFHDFENMFINFKQVDAGVGLRFSRHSPDFRVT